MKIFFFLIISCFYFASLAQDESGQDMSKWPKVLAPGLEIPQGARITVKPASADATLFEQRGGQRPIANASPKNYYHIESASNLGASAASAENNLAGSIADGTAMIKASELKAKAVCQGNNCEMKAAAAAEQNLPYDPKAFSKAVAGGVNNINHPKGKGMQPENCGLKAASDGSNGNPLQFFTSQLGSNYSQGFATNPLTSGGAVPTCALKKAQEAAAAAGRSGRKVSSVMVITDFSGGGPQGKMWIVNIAGNPVRLSGGVPNPVPISGGRGGFSSRGRSNGTPAGAHITRPYREPRGGNILNGIEMDGLEAQNKSTLRRGVLIHAWDPSQPTQGCIGIPGTLKTKSSGTHSNLGGANYYDTLSRTTFKDGGNIVYNYTPQLARTGCK
jgi:hypothetical protein